MGTQSAINDLHEIPTFALVKIKDVYLNSGKEALNDESPNLLEELYI